MIESLGWDAHFAAELARVARADLVPARLLRLERGFGTAMAASGPTRVRLPVGVDASAIAVGDWVALAPGDVFVAVLPRKSALVRKAAGDAAVEQLMAANVDTVFVMMGLDGDVSARRLERWLTVVHGGGVEAVVLLNKIDLCAALDDALAELEPVVRTPAHVVPVHALSAATGEGVEALAPYLAAGRTLVFGGSSGVGKSTLLNRLLGREAQRTAEVRRRDRRGKHTTTFRELFVLPGGAAVIDTPGMRELGLWGDARMLDEAFGDIATLADSCRFSDCRHKSEPGCAVHEAVERGALTAARLGSYFELRGELDELRDQQRRRGRR